MGGIIQTIIGIFLNNIIMKIGKIKITVIEFNEQGLDTLRNEGEHRKFRESYKSTISYELSICNYSNTNKIMKNLKIIIYKDNEVLLDKDPFDYTYDNKITIKLEPKIPNIQNHFVEINTYNESEKILNYDKIVLSYRDGNDRKKVFVLKDLSKEKR